MRRKLAAALIAVTLSSVMIIQPAAAQESENVEAGEDAAAQIQEMRRKRPRREMKRSSNR